MNEEKTITGTAKVEPKTKIVKEFLEYKFTHDEVHEFGGALARASSELKNLENAKKSVGAEFTAKITNKESEIEILSGKIQSGSEYRHIECELKMHFPQAARKTLIRKDNGETVWVKDMTTDELQLKFDFAEEQKAAGIIE